MDESLLDDDKGNDELLLNDGKVKAIVGTGGCPSFDFTALEAEAESVKENNIEENVVSSTSKVPSVDYWRTCDKNVFVLTSAGKPVFVRHGKEDDLVGIMGLCQAIMSRVECHGSDSESLRHIVAGGTVFVFHQEGPLFFVAFTRTGEPVPYVRKQLRFLRQQILMVLSGSVNEVLRSRPSYDVRKLMGRGDRSLLEGIVDMADHSPNILLSAFPYLPLPGEVRSNIAKILTSVHSPKLVYCILLCGSQVVSYVQRKNSAHALAAEDLILLTNFACNSPSLSRHKDSVHFLPICLPHFNEGGFLQAYVGNVAPRLCLMLIGTENDPSYFHILSKGRDLIQSQMVASGAIERIAAAERELPLPVAELGIDGLVHFIYLYHGKDGKAAQHFSPSFSEAWDNETSRRRLWRRYQQLHAKLEEGISGPSSSQRTLLCETDEQGVFLGMRDGSSKGNSPVLGEYTLYAVFSPLINATQASSAAKEIVRWVKSKKSNLFVVKPPSFSNESKRTYKL
eukprot:g2425.t1